MKKTMLFISAVMMFICSYIFLQEQKSLNQISWDNGPSTQTMMISLDNVEVDKEVMLQLLMSTADRYDANLELVSNRTIDGEYFRFHVLDLNYDQPSYYTLISGRELTVNDMNSDYYLATFKTDDPNQIGVYKDLFNDDKVYFMPMSTYVKDHSLYGRLFVSFLNLEDSESFLADLSQALNVNSETLIGNVDSMTLGKDTVSRFRQLNQVIILSFILALVYYIMFHSKKISVMKLNGIGLRDIYIEMTKPILLVEILVSAALVLAAWIIIPDLFSSLLIELIKTIGISVLVSFVVLYVLQKYMSLASLIKNNNQQGWTTIASIATKVFMAIIICSSLGISGTALSYSHEIKNQISNWMPYLNTVFIDAFYQTEDHYCSDFSCFDKDQKGPAFMNAILPYAYYIRNDSYENIQWMSISTNYLDQIQLVDKNGNLLKADENLNHQLILLPMSNPEIDYLGTGLVEDQSDLEIRYYDDKEANIFSYDPIVGADNNYILKSPIIDVKTPSNMTNSDYIYITNPGVIKIIDYADPSVKKAVDELFQNEMHLAPHLITYEESFERRMTLADQLWQSYIPIFVVSFVIYLFVLYQITKLYVQTHIKKYAIQYTLGHSFYRSFQSYFIIIIATWTISIVSYFVTVINQTQEFANMQVITYQMSPLSFLPLIIMILLELLLVTISLLLMKRRSLVIYLKGGQ